jgi:hypothetical protein
MKTTGTAGALAAFFLLGVLLNSIRRRIERGGRCERRL